MVDWDNIAADLANTHGLSVDPTQASVISGGNIASTYRCRGTDHSYFVKLGPADAYSLFEAEAEGAVTLADTAALRVPQVHAIGVSGRCSYLVLEWIEFSEPGHEAHVCMGTQLAELHRATSEQFGWRRANFIGATPQMNEPSKDWPTFYRRCRLQPQLEMVRAKGFGELATRVEAVVGRLGRILGHEPQPALQHGDLWGGNWAADESGQPVIFDSAIHYGDRETDLAMTRLFGGFGEAFYAAYEHAWPLPDGWQQRVAVYQLYHVLNHVNLFGGGYLGQATALLDRLEATP